MSELFKADNEYKEWIAGISTDFRRSQIRASMKINDEMLRFYWKLGKGISSMREQFGYGMGFYKTVSDDLKSILPDVKSFSPTNLKYMRYFYEMYPDAVICPQVEDELITDANRPQVGDDLQINAIGVENDVNFGTKNGVNIPITKGPEQVKKLLVLTGSINKTSWDHW